MPSPPNSPLTESLWPQILDVFNCVERLHDADLRKAIVTEKGEWVLTKIPRGSRPPGKVGGAPSPLPLAFRAYYGSVATAP
jgi:hypothetical protein